MRPEFLAALPYHLGPLKLCADACSKFCMHDKNKSEYAENVVITTHYIKTELVKQVLLLMLSLLLLFDVEREVRLTHITFAHIVKHTIFSIIGGWSIASESRLSIASEQKDHRSAQRCCRSVSWERPQFAVCVVVVVVGCVDVLLCCMCLREEKLTLCIVI